MNGTVDTDGFNKKTCRLFASGGRPAALFACLSTRLLPRVLLLLCFVLRSTSFCSLVVPFSRSIGGVFSALGARRSTTASTKSASACMAAAAAEAQGAAGGGRWAAIRPRGCGGAPKQCRIKRKPARITRIASENCPKSARIARIKRATHPKSRAIRTVQITSESPQFVSDSGDSPF